MTGPADRQGGRASPGELLDPAALEQIEALLPAEGVSFLVEQSVREIEDQVALLEQGLATPDAEAGFHRLVSVAGNLGMTALCAFCRAQEARCRSGHGVSAEEAATFIDLARSALHALAVHRARGDQARDR